MTTSPKVIVFVINDIHRRNGGNASILDLADACHELGANVFLIIRRGAFGKLSYILRTLSGTKTTDTQIQSRKILGLPLSFDRSEKVKVAPKRFLSRVIWCIEKVFGYAFDRESRINKILKDADFVIAAAKLSEKGWCRVKVLTNAKMIFNHAGSPETYKDIWIPEKEKLEHSEKDKARNYERRMRKFDAILFQSPAHEQISRRFGVPSTIEGIVIQPSCEEGKVLEARHAETPYDQGVNVVVVGSIQSRKNQELAIHVADFLRRNHNLTLIVNMVGPVKEEAYQRHLNQLTSTLELEDQIRFWGFREDYLRFIAHSDLLLMLSYSEGVPRVIREAACMGKNVAGVMLPQFSEFYPKSAGICFANDWCPRNVSRLIVNILRNAALQNELALEIQGAYTRSFSRSVYLKSVKKRLLEVR